MDIYWGSVKELKRCILLIVAKEIRSLYVHTSLRTKELSHKITVLAWHRDLSGHQKPQIIQVQH
jgi:hypothetical protein